MRECFQDNICLGISTILSSSEDHNRAQTPQRGPRKVPEHPFPRSPIQHTDAHHRGSSLLSWALSVTPTASPSCTQYLGLGSWNLKAGRNSEITYVNPITSLRRKLRLGEAQKLVFSHKASSWWSPKRRPALLAPKLGHLSYMTTFLSYLECSPPIMPSFQVCIFVEAQKPLRLGQPFPTTPKHCAGEAKL